MDANEDGQVGFKEIQNGHKIQKKAKMFNNEDCFISAQDVAEMKDHKSGK